jgi:hypothetical protein
MTPTEAKMVSDRLRRDGFSRCTAAKVSARDRLLIVRRPR